MADVVQRPIDRYFSITRLVNFLNLNMYPVVVGIAISDLDFTLQYKETVDLSEADGNIVCDIGEACDGFALRHV